MGNILNICYPREYNLGSNGVFHGASEYSKAELPIIHRKAIDISGAFSVERKLSNGVVKTALLALLFVDILATSRHAILFLVILYFT